MVDNLTGLDIYSWETRVSFDPAFLTAVRATSQGSISQKWGSPVYSIAPGSIDIEESSLDDLERSLAGTG